MVVVNVEMGVEMVMLKKLDSAGIPLPSLHPSLHPLPNQSKPIVPTPSRSLQLLLFLSYNFSLYYHNFSFSLITSSYNSHNL